MNKDQLFKEYIIENKSINKIADMTNVSFSTIYRRLEKYNLLIKQKGWGRKDKHHTQESKNKIRKSHLGKKLTIETKNKISLTHKHKKVSDITKNKMRISAFKGGKSSNMKYVLILSHDHPYKNKRNYVFEHRLIVEKQIGRYLKPIEVVHHIDNNTTNNIINNLMLFISDSAHQRWHSDPKKVKPSEILFDGSLL